MQEISKQKVFLELGLWTILEGNSRINEVTILVYLTLPVLLLALCCSSLCIIAKDMHLNGYSALSFLT